MGECWPIGNFGFRVDVSRINLCDLSVNWSGLVSVQKLGSWLCDQWWLRWTDGMCEPSTNLKQNSPGSLVGFVGAACTGAVLLDQISRIQLKMDDHLKVWLICQLF